MIVYGSVLVLIVMFVPRGLSGAGRSLRDVIARASWLSPCCR